MSRLLRWSETPPNGWGFAVEGQPRTVEAAVGIPAFEGIVEEPESVAFIGITDAAATETFLQKLLAYGEGSGDMEYVERVVRGYLTFVDASDEFSPRVALTDAYIVVATGAGTQEPWTTWHPSPPTLRT